jgi:hypothetical protein
MFVCMQHTHFGSATHIAATFLGVLFAGTVWRLAWGRGLTAKSPLVRGLARAAFVQF